MAKFSLPDVIVREDEMRDHLPTLARAVGYDPSAVPDKAGDDMPFPLAAVYDEEIEAVAAQVYQRDYLIFGFNAWR